MSEIVFWTMMFGVTGISLCLWGLVARIAFNRWRADTKANATKSGAFSEIREAIRRAEDAARLQ